MKIRIRKRSNLREGKIKKHLRALAAIKKIGFENIEYIASGQYGSVFRGTWDSHDGVEHAIKAVPYNVSGKSEARVYRLVSDARKRSKEIAKHFPRVDMIRADKENNMILIVMELLEDDPNAKAVIQDMFGYGEVDLWRPDLALTDVDIFKDVGRRAGMMVQDRKTLSKIIDKMLYDFPDWKSKVKQSLMTMNFTNMSFPTDKWRYIYGKVKSDYDITDTVEIIFNELEKTGKPAVMFFINFWYLCVKEWESDPRFADQGYDGIYENFKFPFEAFINLYRTWTPIGMSPKGSDDSFKGAPADTQGAGYPGAETILKAIKLVKAYTGLDAFDMHDQNVLVRPETKDLVIVDLGLFRDSPNRFKRKKYDTDVTVVERSLPHHPKERQGHVERSCHQGLENVISGEDCDRIIEEELKAFFK